MNKCVYDVTYNSILIHMYYMYHVTSVVSLCIAVYSWDSGYIQFSTFYMNTSTNIFVWGSIFIHGMYIIELYVAKILGRSNYNVERLLGPTNGGPSLNQILRVANAPVTR